MIPLPYRDENPTYRAPAITIAIIAANALAFLYQLVHGIDLSVLDYGLIPAWLLDGAREGRLLVPRVGAIVLHQEVPHPFTVLTSMFLHGGFLHLLGNLWFLWIFGDNVEDAMGRPRFVAFYLLCGVAAAMAHVGVSPSSTTPMVGASGAIAGVLGAYLVLYPRARVRCIWVLFVFIQTIALPAWLILGLWFVSQFFVPTGSAVAWMAHVGGFVAGVVLVKLFTLGRPPPGRGRVVLVRTGPAGG